MLFMCSCVGLMNRGINKMVYVCEEWFPNEERRDGSGKKGGFWMDDYLVKQIDVLIKNVHKDWDFTIIISASGEMRIGKSVLAMQIGCYWSYQIWKKFGKDPQYNIQGKFDVERNIAFNGKEIMDKGGFLGDRYNFAALVMDEAADDLESTKVLSQETKAIKDYLRKAAQYNMLNIIVQGEFFEVPKPIAISRSIYLINVDYTIDEDGNFVRGDLKFYSRRNKKNLFLRGKRDLNYAAWKPDFKGSFRNFYPVNEATYRELKAKSLREFKKLTSLDLKRIAWLTGALKYMYQQGLSHREIADILSKFSRYRMHHNTIGKYLKGEKVDEDEDEENPL